MPINENLIKWINFMHGFTTDLPISIVALIGSSCVINMLCCCCWSKSWMTGHWSLSLSTLTFNVRLELFFHCKNWDFRQFKLTIDNDCVVAVLVLVNNDSLIMTNLFKTDNWCFWSVLRWSGPQISSGYWWRIYLFKS